MASTYALPIAPTSHGHSHERSPSQYSSYSNGPTSSPLKANGHRHNLSDMSANGQLHGAVRSPHAEYNGHALEHNHSHSHSHNRSNSNDSSWTLQPFVNGRSKGRARGESDLGRSPPRKNATTAKYGFSPVSPIQEQEQPILPVLSS
jgi:zinc transporter 5/7